MTPPAPRCGNFLSAATEALSDIRPVICFGPIGSPRRYTFRGWSARGVPFAHWWLAMGNRQGTRDAGTGGLCADLVVEPSPGTRLFVVRPCHRRAADWLISTVGDVPVDDRRLAAVMRAALTAGFNVSLAFEAQPRVLGGFPAATDDD